MEIEEYLKQLKSCKTEQEFKDLWNIDLYEFYWCSIYICSYCISYYNDILLKHKVNEYVWKNYQEHFCSYCENYYYDFWSKKKTHFVNVIDLQKYCDKYKHIWEKDYIKWKLKNT